MRGRVENAIGLLEKDRQRIVSMKDRVWILPNPEGTLPRMLDVIDKPISTTFTNDQRDLFVDILLQLLGVYILGLFKDLLQLFSQAEALYHI